MNIKRYAIAAGIVLAASALPAMAATPIDSQQAQGLQSMGNVSVSAQNGSMDDAVRLLSQKAEGEGATHYRIVGLDNPGDSSLWSGTAEIYK